MGITEFIADFATAFIDKIGYAGVFLLMTMESMVFPVPSEGVMPFAGFLIAEGKLTFAGVILFSTIGSRGAEATRSGEMKTGTGYRIAVWATGSAPDFDETLNIARQIAEALEAAHEKGVIHGDLKPSNVMTCTGDRGHIKGRLPGYAAGG